MPYQGGLSGMEAAAYLHAAGFSGSALQTAIAIGKAESGLKMIRSANANSNGTYDWGFMQINDVHKPSEAVKTQPLANAQEAYRIYKAAGSSFSPWSTYASGAYKANMEFARESVLGLQNAPGFEAQLLAGKNPGSDGNPINLSPPVNAIPGLSVPDVPGAISGAANAISSQFAKIGGNVLTVLIALVFIVLGVVILARGAATSGARSVVKGVLK